VASALEQWVSPARTLNEQQARQAQAIVIQAGGLRHAAFEYGGTTLGRLTLERVRYGAQLAKRLGLPVLVTGGSGASPDTEAELMKAVLEQEFGVPVRWVEQRSKNTRKNAAESARLLRPLASDGRRRIMLVTHGFDWRRSRLAFQEVGFDVVSAPTMVAQANKTSLSDMLPHAGALERSYFVSYELMALGALALGLN